MAHLSTKQIKQLIEIDNAGKGIKDEVQALIARLTSGGVGAKSDDPRVAQAKRLYGKGLFSKVESFTDFLATIPEIPEALKVASDRFPELVLVDTRLPISKVCELLGIEFFGNIDFPGNDETYVDYDPNTVKTDKVYWMRAQDGKKNDGKSVQICRKSFAEDEVGLSAYEGLAFFAQNPKSFKVRVVDLPGSVHRDSRGDAAYLGWHAGRPVLYWARDGGADPSFGSASRRK